MKSPLTRATAMALALGAPLIGATGWLVVSTRGNAGPNLVRTASTVQVVARTEERLKLAPVPGPMRTLAPTSLRTIRTLPGPSTSTKTVPTTTFPTTTVPTTTVPTTTVPTTTTTQVSTAPASTTVVALTPTAVIPSTVLPSSVPLPTTSVPPATVPGWRLPASRTYADGSLEFRPMGPSARPKRTQAMAIRLARKAAGPASGNTAVTAQYAQYDAAIGSWLGSTTEADGGTEARPVWVVVFLAVVGQRSTGVVERQHVSTPPTTSRRVVTDVLVVLDDETGEVIVRSEYSSSAL